MENSAQQQLADAYEESSHPGRVLAVIALLLGLFVLFACRLALMEGN